MIRSAETTPMTPVQMEGAAQVEMAVLVGRADGAPHFSMRRFHVAPGGHTPRHAHDYEHEIYILGGRGTFLLDGREHALAGGEAIYVPANTEHQFRAEAGEGLQFLCLVPAEQNCGGPTPGS